MVLGFQQHDTSVLPEDSVAQLCFRNSDAGRWDLSHGLLQREANGYHGELGRCLYNTHMLHIYGIFTYIWVIFRVYKCW